MDADVVITIAFCLEVFLFGLATALFVAREARKARAEAAAEKGRDRPESAEMRSRPRRPARANLRASCTEPPVTPRARGAARGVRP
jgi:hypothetical protein